MSAGRLPYPQSENALCPADRDSLIAVRWTLLVSIWCTDLFCATVLRNDYQRTSLVNTVDTATRFG